MSPTLDAVIELLAPRMRVIRLSTPLADQDVREHLHWLIDESESIGARALERARHLDGADPYSSADIEVIDAELRTRAERYRHRTAITAERLGRYFH